jgi:hypothetical protein
MTAGSPTGLCRPGDIPSSRVPGRLDGRLLALAALSSAAAGVFILVLHARVFGQRLTLPLDLEWMEGGVLVHAYRLAQGKPICVPPSLDFVPFLYPPRYPALLAALGAVFPLGYTLGRAVSLVALALACATLPWICVGLTTERQPRWIAGLVGIAGAVVSGFTFSGSFYDLVRVDSLVLALPNPVFLLAYDWCAR